MPRASTSVASRHCRRAPPVAETSADRHHPRCHHRRRHCPRQAPTSPSHNRLRWLASPPPHRFIRCSHHSPPQPLPSPAQPCPAIANSDAAGEPSPRLRSHHPSLCPPTPSSTPSPPPPSIASATTSQPPPPHSTSHASATATVASKSRRRLRGDRRLNQHTPLPQKATDPATAS